MEQPAKAAGWGELLLSLTYPHPSSCSLPHLWASTPSSVSDTCSPASKAPSRHFPPQLPTSLTQTGAAEEPLPGRAHIAWDPREEQAGRQDSSGLREAEPHRRRPSGVPSEQTGSRPVCLPTFPPCLTWGESRTNREKSREIQVHSSHLQQSGSRAQLPTDPLQANERCPVCPESSLLNFGLSVKIAEEA